jgi:hypothetical protein
LLKVAAVRVSKLADADGTPAPAPTTTASEPLTAIAPGTASTAAVHESVQEES